MGVLVNDLYNPALSALYNQMIYLVNDSIYNTQESGSTLW